MLLSLDASALSATEEWLGVNAVARVGNEYIAKATLPYDDMLVNRVMSLGSGVKVERPEKLRQAVVARCEEIAKLNSAE